MTWTEAVSVGSATVSAAAAVAAVWAAVAAYRAQLMPDVVVYVRHDESRPTLLQIVIENIGRGVATDVRFQPSRPIPTRAWGLDDANLPPAEVMDSGPLVRGIPLLAPGQRRVLAWGQFKGLRKALDAAPLSLRCEYNHGTKKLPAAEFQLEVESFAATDAVGSDEYRVVQELGRMSKSLERIAMALRDAEVERQSPAPKKRAPTASDS